MSNTPKIFFVFVPNSKDMMPFGQKDKLFLSTNCSNLPIVNENIKISKTLTFCHIFRLIAMDFNVTKWKQAEQKTVQGCFNNCNQVQMMLPFHQNFNEHEKEAEP